MPNVNVMWGVRFSLIDDAQITHDCYCGDRINILAFCFILRSLYILS